MEDDTSLESFSYPITSYDKKKFDHLTVMLEKGPDDKGFGIAISGGKDGGFERGGDTSIVISDVIPGSPADSLVRIGDTLIAINGTNVENVNHSLAVNLLRSMKKTVYLLLKRSKYSGNLSRKSSQDLRVSITPNSQPKVYKMNSEQNEQQNSTKQRFCEDYQEISFDLKKSKKGFGLYLGNLIFVKDKIEGTSAYESDLQQGDIVVDINNVSVESCKSTDDVLNLINKCGKHLKLGVLRPNTIWLPKPLTHKTPYVTSLNSQSTKNSFRQNTPTSYTVKSDNRAIKDEQFKNELSQSIKQRRDEQKKSESIPRSKSYSIGNRVQSHESSDDDSVRRIEVKEVKETDFHHVGTSHQVANHLERKGYNRQRSSSIVSSGKETRIIRMKNIGEHLGIQLVGGNKLGIFIASILENSVADRNGLLVGDMLIKANEVDFEGMTREEAVLALLALRNSSVTVSCVNKLATFEKVRHQQGDNFYIRVNFDYLKPNNPKELTLRKGELIEVRDSMYGGTIGSWWGIKISFDDETGESGVIPNLTRAEQLAAKSKLEQRKNDEMKKRLRSSRSSQTKAEYRSQDKLDATSFNDEMIHIPAYVRVVKKAADFKRPVILVGLASDVFRDYLKLRHDSEFDFPFIKNMHDSNIKMSNNPVKLPELRNVIADGKHCLLDVSAKGIELLHHVNISPIVILIKIADKKMASEFREAAVSMVYGKHRDGLSKKEVKNINRYGLRFAKKYPVFLSSVLEVYDQTVDQVYAELLNIIRAKQQEDIYVSDQNVNNLDLQSVEFNEPDYTTASTYSSMSESGTEDENSTFIRTEDDKVFKRNRYDPSSSYDNRHLQTNKYDESDVESFPKSSTRYIDIKYDDDDHKIINVEKPNTKSNITSYHASQNIYHTKYVNEEKGKTKLELNLNAVLKIPADGEGGLIESPAAKVSVYVPPGAFTPKHKQKEFYVKVYLPKGSSRKNNTIQSINPVVVCGPEGIRFSRSVEIRMPMNSSDTEDSRLARIYTCPDYNADFSEWRPLSLDQPGSTSNTFKLANNMIAILIDKF